MNDHELADAVVTLGVGESLGLDVVLFPDEGHWIGVNRFVRDWRVCGALMERCFFHQFYKNDGDTEWSCAVASFEQDSTRDVDVENESLPRAIIEACVKGLQEQ